MAPASAPLPGHGPGRDCHGRLLQARRVALGGLAATLAQAWLCQLPAFVPPRAASAAALAGAEGLGNPRAPALRPARSESPVILGGVVRKTKWVKMASNIINVRKNGVDQYSSKPYKKELKKANFLAQKDAKVNEFMSFARPTPVGGEYVMPVEIAREHLSQMYGREPTLETLTMEDEAGGVSSEDFRNLNTMRRKADPSRASRSHPRRAKMHMGNMPGVSKYIGSLPNSEGKEPPPHTGVMGVYGGSQSDEYQDVWLSGGSVSYNFDPDDQPMF